MQAVPQRVSGTLLPAAPRAAPQHVRHLGQVASRYKGMLLDQFGVLHDGQRPYPGAVDAARRLAESGVKLFIISNSSRRAGGTLSKLGRMGFREEWFAGAVTSGELAHQYLADRPSPWWRGLGRRCLHLTWTTRGSIPLDGLDLDIVGDPLGADFILAHGTEGLAVPGGSGATEELGWEGLRDRLVQWAELRSRRGLPPLPMVVANPDLVTVDGDDLIVMPGTLAKAYRQEVARLYEGDATGDVVRLMGKPAGIIYEACAAALGLPASDVLAVGDSLEHDIAGAQQAGMDSLFIAGGIHKAELPAGSSGGDGGAANDGGGASTGGRTGDAVNPAALEALCLHHSAWPNFVTGYFEYIE